MRSATGVQPEIARLRRLVLLPLLAIAFASNATSLKVAINVPAEVALGKRLFKDARFSSPEGDLANSCNSCHLLDEDPQGFRVHTDFFNRSWVPWRKEDPRRVELRNSPTILDCASMPRLHLDGEFSTIEALVKGTLVGRPMGWLPGEVDRALDQVFKVITSDAPIRGPSGSDYRAQFASAFGADITRTSRDQVIELVVRAISDYLRTQRTSRTAAYDNFVKLNGLPSEPLAGESPQSFAQRSLDRIQSLDSRRALKLLPDFDAAAAAGYKVFLSTRGRSSGNCVTCHAPPFFSDFSFHNMGVSQSEYESIHGNGSYSTLEIPDSAGAQRPDNRFREIPSAEHTDWVDLGFWNFIDLKSSPLRRKGETDNQLLRRMAGAFKTPTLRNLAYSYPYLHNGSINSVEGTLEELRRLSEMAREGLIREPDDELLRIDISRSDIHLLFAFLKSLNEDPKAIQRH
jgi:cytochrome c peroxidase